MEPLGRGGLRPLDGGSGRTGSSAIVDGIDRLRHHRRMVVTYSDLRSKTVLVTGGSRGIGAQTARAFAAQGARVCVVARDRSALDTVVAGITSAGGTAIAAAADVTDAAALVRVREQVEAELGAVDVLCAFAGGQGAPVPTVELTEERWREVLDSELTATFLTIQTFLPSMLERGAGSILTMSSSAGRQPSQANLAYGVAKAGVGMLTRLSPPRSGRTGFASTRSHPRRSGRRRSPPGCPQRFRSRSRDASPAPTRHHRRRRTGSPLPGLGRRRMAHRPHHRRGGRAHHVVLGPEEGLRNPLYGLLAAWSDGGARCPTDPTRPSAGRCDSSPPRTGVQTRVNAVLSDRARRRGWTTAASAIPAMRHRAGRACAGGCSWPRPAPTPAPAPDVPGWRRLLTLEQPPARSTSAWAPRRARADEAG